MKIAFVIQRYGKEIVGGSEYHCRQLAEKLSHSHEVEILTTCADDYITWRSGYPKGVETVNGIIVRRFAICRKRNLRRFKEISNLCFDLPHTRNDELEWVRHNGPESPELVRFIKEHKSDYEAFIFYSFRYYHSYFAMPEVAEKSILVPTAEDDDAIYLSIFKEFFLVPKALLLLTQEEQQLIASIVNGPLPPCEIIGFAVEVPDKPNLLAFRKKYDQTKPFIFYIGRIDRNKGCETLFHFFKEFHRRTSNNIDLLLAGTKALTIPNHPQIRHLGFVSESDKFDGLAACTALIMPSPFESLSIVTLEAWRMGVCTLVDGHCKVLKGQTLRSNGGLYYLNFAEFCECLEFLQEEPEIRQALGASGQGFMQAHFEWSHVLEKVERVLKLLKK